MRKASPPPWMFSAVLTKMPNEEIILIERTKCSSARFAYYCGLFFARQGCFVGRCFFFPCQKEIALNGDMIAMKKNPLGRKK